MKIMIIAARSTYASSTPVPAQSSYCQLYYCYTLAQCNSTSKAVHNLKILLIVFYALNKQVYVSNIFYFICILIEEYC